MVIVVFVVVYFVYAIVLGFLDARYFADPLR